LQVGLLIVALGLLGMTGVIRAGGEDLDSAAGDRAAASRTLSCRVVDGDTLNCDGERIRLLGIDAPEMPGHCRQGRDCAPGDPLAAKASLERAIARGVTIVRVGEDRYGRTLAMLAGASGDLACHQLRAGLAVYVSHWDDGGRVRQACPDLTRG